MIFWTIKYSLWVVLQATWCSPHKDWFKTPHPGFSEWQRSLWSIQQVAV